MRHRCDFYWFGIRHFANNLRMKTSWFVLAACSFLFLVRVGAAPIATSDALIAAVENSDSGATIELAEGTYQLAAPLNLKSGLTLKGAGAGKTIITHVPEWKPSTSTLPDPEMRTKGLDTEAYLLRLASKAENVHLSDLTLRGPQLHGAIYGYGPVGLRVERVQIEDFLWSGIRTFAMREAKILDCTFVDAGGRWERGGKPGVKGGITGGGIFAIWMKDSEIAHNRFLRTQLEKQDEYYGIKVRQAKRCRVHHNTIETNFSMEFPFENDEDNEIDHNVCFGTISLPKHAGGPVPESGRTFRIHHNLMYDTYSIEFVRNGIEIDHNLFDFDVAKDHGNLISGFGKAEAKGPMFFHNNLVSNPGRGVLWINEPYHHAEIRNNHIITRPTATPRTEGLFGFNPNSDFSQITLRDNIIECIGTPRAVFRKAEAYNATVTNNALINVADADRFGPSADPKTVGLEAPLKFNCGVHGEFAVDGWKVTPPAEK